MSTVGASHIVLDNAGVAWIGETNVKVIEVVLDMLAYGWSPAEIHFQHPGLSLGQIHAALGYYYDHQPLMDAEIAQWQASIELLRPEGESPIRQRLKAQGKI